MVPRGLCTATATVLLAACSTDGALVDGDPGTSTGHGSTGATEPGAPTVDPEPGRGGLDGAAGTGGGSAGGTGEAPRGTGTWGSGDDGSTDDGSTDDGSTDDGSTDDGSTGGGSTGDATSDDPGAAAPYAVVPLAIPHAVVFGTFGPGQAWGDLDGDGWLDLVTVGGADPCNIWGNAAGTLQASELGLQLADYLDTAGVFLPDYDNDGDPDIYLLRLGPNVLLRNDGGETLVDVSAQAGIDYDGHPSSATWGDFDGDGHLDLYVTTMGTETDVLYRSQGDGTFVDRTDLLPGMLGLQAFAASFSDLDDDGDVDLYVVNDKGVGNRLWRNDGPGCEGWCFTEVAPAWNVASVVNGMGLAVGDVDNDLDLDLSFSDTHTHNLLRHDGLPGAPLFVDASESAGVTFDAHGWGTLMLDFDNDGWLDLYVADSNLPEPSNRMFRNQQDGTFADVSEDCGCVDWGWAYGVSSADYDVDGRVDFIVGNRSLGHTLYRNVDDTAQHWLEVELHGAGPVNRDAVGTKVYVITTAGEVLRRDIEIGSGLASQSSLRLHFGLGDAEPAAIEIRWPDGTVDQPPTPSVDTLWIHTYPG